jgi:DNA-binding response OmpR family regulator
MSRSILVVDDNVDVAQVLVQVLREEGYAARCAFDGRAALEEIAHSPPDLIVADIVMPHLDGVSLVRQLSSDGHAIPVVLLSAVYDGVDLPSVHFLPKPFELDELLRVITHVLTDHARRTPRPRKWPRA